MNVAIIPSKKKSFRLKNKNTKKIDNLPAIILTIKNLIHSKIFSKIIVSSDDLNIVTLLKYYKLGHTVEFFKRSKKLCNNEVSTRNVILDVIKKMNIKSNNIVTCVYPTSFLINKNDIKSSIKLLKKNKNFYIVPVCNYEYSINKHFFLDKKNKISKLSNNFHKEESTPLINYYHDVGQFYIGSIDTWKKNKDILGKKTICNILPLWRCQDIDYLYQWAKAKKIYEKIIK
tara:strand:- start:26662 stop:27351 length:690 start_codon:yes stop_codon:yes gene_type:complete